MANVLEYTLSLNDKISGKLQKIGVASETSLNIFANLQKQTNAVNKVMGDMGRTVGSLQQRVALLKNERDWIPATAISDIRRYNSEIKSLEKEINKLQTINGSKFKTLAKDALNQMPGSSFILNPLVAAGAGIGIITRLGMENEKTAVSFEVLLGSQDKAAGMLKDMSQYAASTPYEKMGLQEAGKMMLGFGISQEKIMPNLKMIGDIAMGDANKMNSLTLAYSQMSSAGKLTGQDLLQMVNAGFNPLNEISKMTGRSIKDLRDDMEKGKISADMVTAAFQHATGPGGLFYNMTEKIGKTIGGRLSTAIDNLKEVALSLFNIIGPILSPALKVLNFTLGLIVGSLNWFFDGLKEGNPWIMALASALGVVAVALGINYALTKKAWIMAKLKTAWDAVSATTMGIFTGAVWANTAAWLANPLVWIPALIAALVAAIVVAWNKFEKFRGAIYGVWAAIKGFANLIKEFIIDRIKGILTGIGGLGKALVELFSGDFKKAWKTATQAGSDIIGVDAYKNAVGNAREIGKNVGTAYQKGISDAKEKKEKAGLENNKIAAPNIPGTDIAANSAETSKTGADKTTEAISTGGTRNTSININLGKMVENIVFNGSLKENRAEVESQLEESLLRVLNMAYSAG